MKYLAAPPHRSSIWLFSSNEVNIVPASLIRSCGWKGSEFLLIKSISGDIFSNFEIQIRTSTYNLICNAGIEILILLSSFENDYLNWNLVIKLPTFKLHWMFSNSCNIINEVEHNLLIRRSDISWISRMSSDDLHSSLPSN